MPTAAPNTSRSLATSATGATSASSTCRTSSIRAASTSRAGSAVEMYTQEMLADPKALASLGLNARELRFLKDHPFPELAGLYYAPYYSAFHDEYRPFDAGLDALDAMSTTELFRRDGASPGALKLIGGSGSALQSVWHAAIRHMRGIPLLAINVFRLTGRQPDAAGHVREASR